MLRHLVVLFSLYCGLAGADDQFGWLEDVQSPAVKEWITQQNAGTRSLLDPIPVRAALNNRMRAMSYAAPVMPSLINGKYFAIRGGSLVVSDAWNTNGTVLVNPQNFDPRGFGSIADYKISPDGTKVAFALSFYGSDLQDWYVRNLSDGSDVAGFPLKNIRIRGTSWSADSSGLYYTLWPTESENAAGERFNKVYFHSLGARPSEDTLIYSTPKDFSRGVVGVEVNGGSHVLLYSYNGFDDYSLVKVRAKNESQWKTLFNDKYITTYIGNLGKQLFYRTNACGNNFCLAYANIDKPGVMRPIVRATRNILTMAQWIGSHFVLTYSTYNLETEVHIYSMQGQLMKVLKFNEPGMTSAFTGDRNSSESYFSFTGYRTPTTVYRYNFADHTSTALNTPSVPVNFANVETKLIYAYSTGGAWVPVQLIYRKGIKTRDIKFTYLYAYGFGGSDGGGNILASYSTKYLTVLEMGGVVAIANVRGGGEFGEAWHWFGKRFNKQNTFDDTIAAAQMLIGRGWAQWGKISLYGRSGGGLTAAAAMVQRPDLFGSVAPAVPLTDMMRYQYFSPSSYRWAAELGLSSDGVDYLNLLRWSPYHNVRSIFKYPPTIIFGSDHDDRAGMAHALKFAAALQNVGAPAYLYVTPNVGHFYRGETLDELTFIANVYGIEGLVPL